MVERARERHVQTSIGVVDRQSLMSAIENTNQVRCAALASSMVPIRIVFSPERTMSMFI